MKTLQERQKSPEFALFSQEIAEKLRSGAVKTQVKSLKTQVSRDALIWPNSENRPKKKAWSKSFGQSSLGQWCILLVYIVQSRISTLPFFPVRPAAAAAFDLNRVFLGLAAALAAAPPSFVAPDGLTGL